MTRTDIIFTEGGDGTHKATCLDCTWSCPSSLYRPAVRDLAARHIEAFPSHAAIVLTIATTLIHTKGHVL